MTQGKPPVKPFKYHVLMCTGPRCAPEVSPNLYAYLKEKIRLSNYHDGPKRVHRSQCQCLGICEGGPLAVVYPDNVWYGGLTREKVDRIFEEHLIEGRPVAEDQLPSA